MPQARLEHDPSISRPNINPHLASVEDSLGCHVAHQVTIMLPSAVPVDCLMTDVYFSLFQRWLPDPKRGCDLPRASWTRLLEPRCSPNRPVPSNASRLITGSRSLIQSQVLHCTGDLAILLKTARRFQLSDCGEHYPWKHLHLTHTPIPPWQDFVEDAVADRAMSKDLDAGAYCLGSFESRYHEVGLACLGFPRAWLQKCSCVDISRMIFTVIRLSSTPRHSQQPLRRSY